MEYSDIYSPITAEELQNIPEEMKKEPRWICWGSNKIPVSVTPAQNGTHYGINVTAPENWGTFEQATAAIGTPAYVKYVDENFHIVGVGFVVGDGWFCADLDGGAGHNAEEVPEEPIKSAVIDMHPYTEKSVSGCGYHVFGKCDFDSKDAEKCWPHRGPDGKKVPESYAIEFFTRRKFIAITGRIVETEKYCSNTHINTAFSGISGARIFYDKWVLPYVKMEEEIQAAECAKVAANVTINMDDAAQMFLLNYPEILAASDSSNFKRGGPGVKLAPGEYSWIAAVKAMQEIGIPESDIIDWCRRGSNFKSEKDVLKVLDKDSKPGAASVAGIVADAKAHGWRPDPDKLTGEAKRNHEWKVYEEEQLRKFREEHREEHAAQLAALGIDCAGDPYRFTWSRYFDGSIDKVIEKETGEIVYTRPEAERAAAQMELNNVRLADPAAAAPAAVMADPAAPWERIVKAATMPGFPLEAFPLWIGKYIENFSENTGISKDFCAACVLGAVSAVICGRINVNFNRTHYEPAQLYTVFVGRSGSMKSTAVKQFTDPARTWLQNSNRVVKEQNAAILEEIRGIQSDLDKGKHKRGSIDELQKAELKAEIEQKQAQLKAQYPVPFSDVTPESLLRTMITSNGAANIISSEGNVINVLTGHTYSQRGTAPNLDIFLNGYDGEPYHNYRVTTGEVDLPRVDISILLSIQPRLLETLCNSDDANGRGLVQRFLIFAPEETDTAIDHTIPNTTSIDYVVKWDEHIQTIAERFMHPDSPACTMELDMMADRIIRECWNYEEILLRERGSDDDGVTGWISKMHGKALRLAAILAILNNPSTSYIADIDAEKAVFLLKEYFLPHYIGSFETVAMMPREERTISHWILRHAQRTGNRDTFTEHEAYVDLRQRTAFAGKAGQNRFRLALDNLQTKNIIRPIAAENANGSRGRTIKTWQINPEIYTIKIPR